MLKEQEKARKELLSLAIESANKTENRLSGRDKLHIIHKSRQ